MKEMWKDIIGYEGVYKISTNGVIVKYAINHPRIKKEFILKQQMDHGYCRVFLYKTGLPICRIKVHRLMLLTFVGECLEHNRLVNHKNGIKNDNRLENLEWCSASQNMKHAYENGFNGVGEKRYNSKLKNSDIPLIRKMKDSNTYSELSSIFGVSRGAIFQIVKGNNWKYVDDNGNSTINYK